MPGETTFLVPPQNYFSSHNRKWQVTGFNIEGNNPYCEFIDHSTGLAKFLFSGAATSGDFINNGGLSSIDDATGIYSASGEYDKSHLRVSWGVAHPFTQAVFRNERQVYKYIDHFEINLYDQTGKFATGYNFLDNGTIRSARLTSPGSGYIDPYVQVNGDGANALIEVATLGTGTHSNDQDYVVLNGDTGNNVLSFPESGVSGMGYLTGISIARIVSGGSGYTRQKTSLQILDHSGSGQGAKMELDAFSFGLKGQYFGPTVFDITPEFNREAFGSFTRDYQVEIINKFLKKGR